MKISRLRSIVPWLGLLVLVGLCYILASQGDKPAPDEIAPYDDGPTATAGPAPMPALVGFDSICQAQQKVRVEGFLHLPDSTVCSGGDGEGSCTVYLTDFLTREQLLVSLPVGGEPDAPVPGHMVGLPIPYEVTDFRVAAGGRWAGEGSLVRLTGWAEPLGYIPSEGLSCRLVDVSRVEKLERFTRVDGQARQVTLRAALKEGWVEIAITGDGLSQIDLRIEPKVDFNLSLEVEAGTIFLAEAAGVQNMVVRKQSFVYLTPGLEAEVELEVSCANMRKKEPRRDDTFTVLPDLAPQDLIDLVSLSEFVFEPMRIQQFSVWTVTDNPPRDGYVGLQVSFSSEGSGPSDEELARIRELFELAGMEPDAYTALQE